MDRNPAHDGPDGIFADYDGPDNSRTLCFDPSQATLIYSCPDCGAEYCQGASELVEGGTAICLDKNCNHFEGDCALDRIEVKTEKNNIETHPST